jgi:hypothetical protein
VSARAVDAQALQSGIAIEWRAIGWMVLEAAISAGVLLRRLSVERDGGSAQRVQMAERRASAVVAGLLYALSRWVLAGRDLLLVRSRPERSLPGLLLASSAGVMPWIVSIGSAALRADAASGIVYTYMAVTLLLGLALRSLSGWWWAEPLAALGMVSLVAREGAAGAARGRADHCGCCD